MNEKISLNISNTQWDRLATMVEDEIDTSDTPELNEEFFASAKLRLPADKSVDLKPDAF